jgi:hypothetical protein
MKTVVCLGCKKLLKDEGFAEMLKRGFKPSCTRIYHRKNYPFGKNSKARRTAVRCRNCESTDLKEVNA